MKKPMVMQGNLQALVETPLGKSGSVPGFLRRFQLLNAELCEDAPLHVATHLIKDLKEAPAPYVHAHSHHSCDEIGLVVGEPGALEYEICLGDETHRVTSPGSIFIPAGTVHRARALRGNGAYVCILMDPAGPNPGNSESSDN